MPSQHPNEQTISLPGLGKITGKRSKTRNNVPINVFKAIPYAKPHVGKLRFALPQPPDPWKTTLDCTTKESNRCMQPHPLYPASPYFIRGEEDCLYLNVYTTSLPMHSCSMPSLSQSNVRNVHSMTNLPVLVWIHGGAFCIGSNDTAMYGPDYILDHDVVLVGCNYRLGLFGFLSLECDEAPG